MDLCQIPSKNSSGRVRVRSKTDLDVKQEHQHKPRIPDQQGQRLEQVSDFRLRRLRHRRFLDRCHHGRKSGGKAIEQRRFGLHLQSRLFGVED